MLMSTFGIVGAIPASAAKTSVLNGKSAIFVGDSIMAGWRDSINGQDYANGRGWGYRIRDNYSMTVNIAARAGEAMSSVRDAYMDPIYKQLENNKNTNYDYVILEGGFNDIMGNERSAAKETAPLGTMSTSFNLADFDRSTFASGLEHLLCTATTLYPNAKIGFVITFETPYSNRGNGTNNRENTKKYFDLAKQICDKWNVPYLDFYDGTTADGTKYFDIFYPEGTSLVSQYPNGLPSGRYGTLQRIKDDIHPNTAGYDMTCEYVAAWMETLPTYSKPSATSVLRGKTALFAGDSITYGYKDSVSAPRSWAYRLQNNYGMVVSNMGQNGHSLSDVRNYAPYGNVDKRLHTKCFPAGKYDYVILHGGVNDIIGAEEGKGHPNPGVAVAVGTVAATKNPADFDTATFAGGLERYFYEATTRYPSARIGFIINYKTPNSTWGGSTKNADAYWAVARQICDKWDVSYLDLYQDAYSIDVLKANTNTYLCDTLHLNAAGYDLISPYIAQWMATLEPYSDEQEPAPDVDAFVDGTEYHYDYSRDYDGMNGTKYYSAKEDGTDYNNCISLSDGVDTRLVTGGYNNAAYAMKMSYTKNASTTANKQYYAMFSVPNIHSVNKNGRKPGQAVYLEGGATFKITVTYKVTGYASDAALYVGIGSIALSNMIPTFTDLNAAKVTDITATTDGWQKAQVVYTSPQSTGFYLLLKMADDTKRAGTEVLVGAIDITSAKTTVISFDSNGGTAVESVSGKAGEVIPYPADPTREGYTFDGWYTVTDKASAAVFPLVDVTYVARWKSDKDGWVQESGKWAYYVDGEKLTSQWQKDSVGWCYLGADGYMLTNAWVKDSVGWCYVGANGYCLKNTWQKDSHGWCYLDANGRMMTNAWVKDSKGWCYVGADGYCVTNAWKKDSHGWCYLDGNGRMATNQWVKDSKGWCYVGADGYCVTNAWKKDSHGWCYLDANGRMVVSDWVKDGGKWYYLDGNGYMVANKTLKLGGTIYTFNASGVWTGATVYTTPHGTKYHLSASCAGKNATAREYNTVKNTHGPCKVCAQ